jgi:hypothetical protein
VSPTNLFHPGTIAVAGSLVVFASEESNQGASQQSGGIPTSADLNNDGDVIDRTLRIYDATSGSGTVTNLPYAVQLRRIRIQRPLTLPILEKA